MTVNIPGPSRQNIFDAAFRELDDFQYLTKTRPENADLLDRMVDHPDIGVKLRGYIPSERVRTYIKDTIINRYAKVRTELPQDVNDYLKVICSDDIYEIDYLAKDHVSLNRTSKNGYYAVARSKRGHTSWPIALRNLLFYLARLPDCPPEGCTEFVKVLIIFCHGVSLNSGDKEIVDKALSHADVFCIWID